MSGRLPLAQVPHRPGTVVGAGGEEMGRLPGPGHDVDVGGADRHAERRSMALGSDVPDLDAAIATGRGEDRPLRRRPLHLFHAAGMAGERSGVGRPRPALGLRRHEDLSVVVARQQLSLRDQARPVERVSFRPSVHAERHSRPILRRRDPGPGPGRIERGQVRTDVVHQYLPRLEHHRRQRRRSRRRVRRRDLMRSGAVGGGAQRQGPGLHDGVGLFAIVVVVVVILCLGVGPVRAVALCPSKAAQFHDQKLVLAAPSGVSLRAGHGVDGGRVRPSIVPELIRDEIERQTRPGRRQGM